MSIMWKLPALLLLLGSSSIAHAQGATASSPPEFARRAASLKPGQWVWAAKIAPSGPILVYVDLSRQLATVYRNGLRVGVATVSSGKEGYETPTGVFTILQKDATHRSKKYNNAPMPFQQRLTWDGVALHAGGLPGYPESHGCVHLPYGFSKELFAITSLGATVVVMGDAAEKVETTEGSLLAPIDAKGAPVQIRPLETEEFRWEPEKSPTGPVTIIVAKRDQRIVILRNGVEIGRSAAEINDPDPNSQVISLTSFKDGKPQWTYLGLPGHEEDANRQLDDETINRVRLPRGFYAQIKTVIALGTTILVTASSVGAIPDHKITIMDATAPRG